MKASDKTNLQDENSTMPTFSEPGYLSMTPESFVKIEEVLNQERDLYMDLANALPSGIYRLRVFHDFALSEDRWSSSTNAPYRIEFVNDRFCNILNLERNDFEANPGKINNIIFEEDKSGFIRLNIEANQNMTPFLWEGRMMIRNELVWVHFESVPRLMDNGDIIWTGTLNDISDRKNAEIEINQKNQELQKLNAAKDKFFSIIAHDLKSPFNSIVGFSELMLADIKEKEFDRTGEYANIVLQSSHMAMDLLSNLMEWAQSQTGRMNFNPVNFNIGELVNETMTLLKGPLSQKLIDIENDLPQFLLVFADKAMISTVLRNIISNSVKFSPPGGKIVISSVNHVSELIVSVCDNGVGISEERVGNLFNLDGSHSTRGTLNEKGTGLGLIICKEFVEKNGGKIGVESNEGFGSTFFFSLPKSRLEN